ncbi:protein FAM83B [Elephas maximus indicus]|uniref:protein FAM83B n=1 Tax=Elephas maximus indicus TaxID=99487 RepID=UPI0021163138|nr:protein FAM83B [Elephas maximus indicus]XP_049750443.1 protein FAM83B [Elephas maximus indicus]XP_049750451.1 protein FAM83B [Elephas maximus indicus]XP_049750461.1 protein FAM83B [Elephas maximus indicus]XP_049750470.1 protein FAM83B [Elephas maximus indicus]
MLASMETSSMLSSLNDECKSDNYIEPHYKEWYRVAVDTLIEHGLEAYQEFLANERVSEFLAEEEIDYILKNVQKVAQSTIHGTDNSCDDTSSSGTYWPIESDVEAPNLDLGWPYVMPGLLGGTHIELLFNPPRAQLLTIKETVRKMIKEARKVIALVMDIFTDVDIFKEIVEASARGISVYILLDESNFNHFLNMTEKQGCQVQRLRNIRVRTVKGQDYLSKTGAKFHGKLQQKFLLVDCQKVMYGSYSYMWSFEKAHLSMVQIITGQLVESFDEEFRTLYARSCVPSSFAQEESVRVKHGKALWENGIYQHAVSSLASVSSQRNLFGRQDNIHKLDSSYFKNRGIYTLNDHDKYNIRNLRYKPHFVPNFNGPNTMRQHQPSQLNENWKRHSYAGEQPETVPYLLLNRALNRTNNPPSNWKRPSDSLSVASSSRGGYTSHRNTPAQSFADRLAQRKTTNLAERNSNVRRSFNGTDNHVRFLQQRMPTLEHTTKSFLRNWRIESYLNDHSEAAPDSNGSALGDHFEGYDGSENLKANALYTHSRLRSSFVFKPTLPEQQEVNSCTTESSNSTIIGSQGSNASNEVPDTPTIVEHLADKAVSDSVPMLPLHSEVPKMHTLQVPENHSPVLNHTTNGHSESDNYIYTTLGANKQTENLKNQQNENLLKRRSFPFFDHTKGNLDHGNSKHYVYSTLTRNQVRQPEKPKEDLLISCKSMHNVTRNMEDDDEVVKRDPPSSTTPKSVSVAALLDVNKEESNKELTSKKEVKGSPNFLKKGSQKLRSLLSLTPEKKENLSKNKAPAFYRMCSSSDTLVSEGEENQKPKKSETKVDSSPRRKHSSSSNSQGSLNKSKEDVTISSSQGINSPSDESNKIIHSPAPAESKFLERAGDASAPRFNTEQIQYRDSREINAAAAPERSSFPRSNPSELLRTHSMDRRVYSRFEPFCKIESSIQPTRNLSNTNIHCPEIKSSTMSNNYGRSSPLLNYNSGVYRSYQPNEKKFRGFMQKFGNFIHKNK